MNFSNSPTKQITTASGGLYPSKQLQSSSSHKLIRKSTPTTGGTSSGHHITTVSK